MPFRSATKQAAYMRRYYRANRNSIRVRQLAHERGPAYWRRRERKWKESGILLAGQPVTAEAYQAILKFQGDACALCGRDSFWGSLQLDHDHKTGEARGILCHECNHRAVSIFERTGRFKSADHERRLREYLLNSPVVRWFEAGRPSAAKEVEVRLCSLKRAGGPKAGGLDRGG